jgi:Fe-S-cluster containining protein
MDECNQSGVCCKLFAINLNEKEYFSGKFKTEFEEFGIVKDFLEAEMIGANILTRLEDGSCIYLKDKICSIHKTRPQVCRGFFCNSEKEQFKDMITQINLVKQK